MSLTAEKNALELRLSVLNARLNGIDKEIEDILNSYNDDELGGGGTYRE